MVITDIEYRPGSAANTTTGMISKYTVSGNGWSQVYEYTYDARGNIATIKKNGTEIVSYLYDEQNQLVYENNAIENKAYYYPYSGNGNLACRVVYPYGLTYEQAMQTGALSSDNYMYENPNWPDQLTWYEGSTITYDGIGNPLSYRGWTFDWEGRQLTSASNGYYTIGYQYDADGIRTSKTVNGVTTYYTYEGGKLRAQKTGDEIIWFQYGADGTPMSMTIGSATYYYVKNMQGDVIGLTDTSGNLVVQYTYDAWGKFLSISGSLASSVGMKNPFWYRGYYFDTETGFYYLQSRYYDPVIRRFINADDIIAATNLSGMNLYAYCGNNPFSISITLSATITSCNNIVETVSTSSSIPPVNSLAPSGNTDTVQQSNTSNLSSNTSSKPVSILRDVTIEVITALRRAADFAHSLREFVRMMPAPQRIGGEIGLYTTFLTMVNHGAVWDIKRPIPWTLTIGTPFPGQGVPVLFFGQIMTVEDLGNFAYGYLGGAFGFPYQMLITGSYVAANFPDTEAALYNEIKDVNYIMQGYLLGYLSYNT